MHVESAERGDFFPHIVLQLLARFEAEYSRNRDCVKTKVMRCYAFHHFQSESFFYLSLNEISKVNKGGT